MKRLRENGYITMNRDGLITLTEKGLEIANRIYERHKVPHRCSLLLGVDLKTARRMPAKWSTTSAMKPLRP